MPLVFFPKMDKYSTGKDSLPWGYPSNRHPQKHTFAGGGNLFGIIKWQHYVLVLSFYDSDVNDYGCGGVNPFSLAKATSPPHRKCNIYMHKHTATQWEQMPYPVRFAWRRWTWQAQRRSLQDVPRITPSHTLIRSPKYTRMLVEFVTCLDTAARQGKISIKFLLSTITIIIDI